MARRRSTEKFAQVDPALARTYAVAQCLGEVLGSSTETEGQGCSVAWAFAVRRPAHPSRVCVVAGAQKVAAVVLLEIEAERAQAGLLMARAIASSSASTGLRLAPGVEVVPDLVHYPRQAALRELSGVFRLEAAAGLDPRLADPDCVWAHPAGDNAAIRAPLAKLEASLLRLQRLEEREAPIVIVQSEQAHARRLLAALEAESWDPEQAPLPQKLRPLACRLLGR